VNTPIPLVLVHGAVVTGRTWDGLIPDLSGPAPVVDRPGRGTRPMPPEHVDPG
jgi:hypothetical protein